MKRALCLIIVFCVVFSSLITTAQADEISIDDSLTIEYLPDGSYFVIELCQIELKVTSDRGTSTHEKQIKYYNANNELQWTMKLFGTFTYNGVSATCTSATVSYTISESSWHYDSSTSSASGNTAYGTLTMVKKFLGIPVNTITKSLTITCDPNGYAS